MMHILFPIYAVSYELLKIRSTGGALHASINWNQKQILFVEIWSESLCSFALIRQNRINFCACECEMKAVAKMEAIFF